MKVFQTHVFLCVLVWAAHASDFKSSVGTRLRRTRDHAAPQSKTFVGGYTDNIAQSSGNAAPNSGNTSPLQADQAMDSSRTPVRRVLKGRRPVPARKPSNVPTPDVNPPQVGTPLSSFRTANTTTSINILAGFAGRNRVLVISAPDESDGYYKLMMSLLKPSAYCEMAERHIQQIVLFHGEGETGGRVRRVNALGSVVDEPLEPAMVPRLMNFLNLEEGKFSMVLLRKTLQVEERYPYPVRLEAVYEAIDRAPMRRLEKARQKGFAERCRASGMEGRVVWPARPETAGSESHMRIAPQGGEGQDGVEPIPEPTRASTMQPTTTAITGATTRPITTSTGTTKPATATAAVTTGLTVTPALTVSTSLPPTTPDALAITVEHTHPQTASHRHKATSSTSHQHSMHSRQRAHVNTATHPSNTTGFITEHRVRQKEQKIPSRSSVPQTHRRKPVKDKLPNSKNTGKKSIEERGEEYEGGKPTVTEPEENLMPTKDHKNTEENTKATKDHQEPEENLMTTKHRKEPAENPKTTIDHKEPEDNLMTTKRRKEPAVSPKPNKDLQEPEENLMTTKRRKEPAESTKATKDHQEPEENLMTTKRHKEPAENSKATKDHQEPEENLMTTKHHKEPAENSKATKDHKEPEENLMSEKTSNDKSERRKKMERPERPSKKNSAEKKAASVLKVAEPNVRNRNTAKKGSGFEEKGAFVRPTEKPSDPKRSLETFLSYFEKRRRLLVITSPSKQNAMYTQQRDEYLEQVCDMALRKISIITIFGPLANGTMKIDHYQMEQDKPVQVLPTGELINQELITAFRKELGMLFNDFYMVLTDFDMKVKQEYEVPITMKAVFDYIDTFSSRLREMELQRNLGIACKKEDKSRSLENFLSRFRWRRRLLVISAPDHDEWAYQQQLHALTSQACNLGLRHMSVLKFVGRTTEDTSGVLELYPVNGSASMEREDLTSSLVRDIRNYFQISAEYFSMLLVGKDGNVKSWYPSPMWSLAIIYDLVDSMQLRRQEMAIQLSLGMRCPEDDYSHHDGYHDGYRHGYGY